MLIQPNPESALNEEAGKMLLEEYDEYFKRAKMLTDIYAKDGDENLCINTNELAKRDKSSTSNNKIFSAHSSSSNKMSLGKNTTNYSKLSLFTNRGQLNNDMKKRTLKRI